MGFQTFLILYSLFKDTVSAIKNLKDVRTKNYANLTMIVERMVNVNGNVAHCHLANVIDNVNAIKNLKNVRSNGAKLKMIVERMVLVPLCQATCQCQGNLDI